VSKRTEKQIELEKYNKTMQTVAKRCAYYRENPQRFVKDYLNINLKVFQKILIYAMMHNYFFMFIAARGLGKTWLTALFCCVRCILFPGSKVVICSGTRPQGNQILQKIQDEFLKNYTWGSANLNNEIEKIKIGANDGRVEFKNGSFMTVVIPNDNARGNRGNILIVDEFRIVDKKTINTVLKKFLSAPRAPLYLGKPQYKHLLERNMEIYMSSAWYESHWSYKKLQAYFKNMMLGKKYFCCALPYQLSIKEGLLMKSQVEDEMSEDDFDDITWSIEMDAVFYSDTNGSFYTFEDVDSCRKLNKAFYPMELYKLKREPPPKLIDGERRILSVDVALMSSKKNNNDAASFIVNSAVPLSNDDYMSNIVYLRNYEGLTTDELGMKIMSTFYFFKCDTLVVDYNGVGIGVLDYILMDHMDDETGEYYKALNVANNDELSSRCKVKDAKKCIYAIKATASFNNDISRLLRSGFRNGRIRLLINEFDADAYLRETNKSFYKIDPREQALYRMPYLQTSLLVHELINLEYEIANNNLVRIYEKPGMRKDRYSSVAYNYWVLNKLSKEKKNNTDSSKMVEELVNLTKKPTRHIGLL